MRHGAAVSMAVARLPGSKLTDAEQAMRSSRIVQWMAKMYRTWQGDDSRLLPRGQGASRTYDADAFMQLSTAARVYTLLGTVRRNNFNARQLAESTGRGGLPDGYFLQDPAFVGMLIADNQALTELYAMAGQPLPSDLTAAIDQTKQNLSVLWDDVGCQFAARLPQEKILLPEQTGIEAAFMLLGGVALQQTHIDQTILHALRHSETLQLPTITSRDEAAAGKIDRGGFSPWMNSMLYRALGMLFEGHDEAKLLQRRIGISILEACIGTRDATGKVIFSRQYNSRTGQPIGQSVWRPTAAAVQLVAADMLA